ncbi:uncharacterized protein KY384_008340 [Bacidia gigantensis]|uniref:uncharacterized protein n=1 Tax=Bacidia gigantensis TaxID=2732470 RepID=UPI001D0361A9|nr:uncharacterized protein KY384_008340 [Bacidia gigantensis]KAG8526911.1 hypothetical protein KY384_008340 [Bacidia gigantensis]
MECLAHNARYSRSKTETSSLEAVRAMLAVDPIRYKSNTRTPLDTAVAGSRAMSGTKPPHVCVVGAGMAGLSPKWSTQLEAHFDRGSNWIHGSKNNPILRLARELDSVCFEPPEGESANSPIYDRSGQELDSKTALAYSAETWDIIDEAIRYSQKDRGLSIPPEKSLIDYFSCAIKVRNYDEPKSKLILDMARMWSDIVGEPVEKQSLRYMWLEECIEGGKPLIFSEILDDTKILSGAENWFLASTYAAILDRIHRDCLACAEILLEKQVTKIQSVRSHEEGQHAILIDTTDGTSSAFDEVVMTAPLGWLKRNQSAFAPSLPLQLNNAIDHIGFGRLEKVYIHFPFTFWQSGSSKKEHPLFFQFLTPEYAPESNPHQWTIECVSLASLPQPCDHATLLFYVNGPTSAYVTALVRDDEVGSSSYYNKLEAFFSPYYSRLPNYDSETCRPSSFYNTDWQNDDLAGNGSYSTFQVSDYERDGLVELDKDIEILRFGCPERNLWFAGEHVAPTLALGTTTGAYWSGEAVADRIAALYGRAGAN